jgi:hypothetical protein
MEVFIVLVLVETREALETFGGLGGSRGDELASSDALDLGGGCRLIE